MAVAVNGVDCIISPSTMPSEFPCAGVHFIDCERSFFCHFGSYFIAKTLRCV